MRLFTGNYGSALGNYGQAAQLQAQAGANIGQALQSVGQTIAGAIEKHEEKKQREALSPLADELVKNIQDPGQREAAKKSLLSKQGLDMYKNIQQLNITQEAHDRAEKSTGLLNQMRKVQLKNDKLDLEMNEALQSGNIDLAKKIQANKITMADLESAFLDMGGMDPGLRVDVEKAKAKAAKLAPKNIQSQIDYRKGIVDANKASAMAKLLEKTNPSAATQINEAKGQIDDLLGTPFEIDGKTLPLKEIIESDEDWTKGGKFDNPELSTAIQTVNALSQRISNIGSTTKRTVRRKNTETGDVEEIEMTVAEYMQAQAESEQKKAAKKKSEKERKNLEALEKMKTQRDTKRLEELRKLEEEMGIFDLGGI